MKNKVIRFMETLDEYGEMYFSSGDYKQDYKQIMGVIKAQGYFSGCYYRLYFNDNLDLIRVEDKYY